MARPDDAYSFEAFRTFQELLAFKSPWLKPLDSHEALHRYQERKHGPLSSSSSSSSPSLTSLMGEDDDVVTRAFQLGVTGLPKPSIESLNTFIGYMQPVTTQDLQLEAVERMYRLVKRRLNFVHDKAVLFSMLASSKQLPTYFSMASHVSPSMVHLLMNEQVELLTLVTGHLKGLKGPSCTKEPSQRSMMVSYLDDDDDEPVVTTTQISQALHFIKNYLVLAYSGHHVWYLVLLHQMLFMHDFVPLLMHVLTSTRDLPCLEMVLQLLTLIGNQGAEYGAWLAHYEPWRPLVSLLTETRALDHLARAFLMPMLSLMPIYVVQGT